MKNKLIAVPALALTLASGFSVTACQSSGGSPSAAKSGLHAMASDPAVQQAVQRGKTVAAGCVTSTHSVSGLKKCLISAVPPAKRAQVKNCLIKDALADHLTTRAGRKTFEQTSAPLCVGQALPPVAATPSASKA